MSLPISSVQGQSDRRSEPRSPVLIKWLSSAQAGAGLATCLFPEGSPRGVSCAEGEGSIAPKLGKCSCDENAALELDSDFSKRSSSVFFHDIPSSLFLPRASIDGRSCEDRLWVSWGGGNKVLHGGAFKQQECVLSLFWGLRAPGQGRQGWEREAAPRVTPAFCSLAVLIGVPCPQVRHPGFCLQDHVAVSRCLALFLLFNKDNV